MHSQAGDWERDKKHENVRGHSAEENPVLT
jgi:hypothetical protein